MSNMFIAIKLIAAAIAAKLNKHVDLKSQKGVTIIEYALLGALIAAVLISTMTDLQVAIKSTFDAIALKL